MEDTYLLSVSNVFASNCENSAVDGVNEQAEARLRTFIELLTFLVRFSRFIFERKRSIQIFTKTVNAALWAYQFSWKNVIQIRCNDWASWAIDVWAYQYLRGWITYGLRANCALCQLRELATGRIWTLSLAEAELLGRRSLHWSCSICLFNIYPSCSVDRWHRCRTKVAQLD